MSWLTDFLAAVGRVIAYPFIKIYEFFVWFFGSEYFFALLPMFISIVYPILWATGAFENFEGEIYLLFQLIEYDWFFVPLTAGWLTSFPHSFFTAITIGLVQVILVVIAAVLETLIVYVLFFGIGSIIFALIQLVFWLALLVALPIACVVYAIALLRRQYAGMGWLHIMVLIVTSLAAGMHLIFSFSNIFEFGCSCG